MFEIIDTPFSPVNTVRLDSDDTFRPCSTGIDISELKIRTLMENFEVSNIAENGIIASAAHTDKETSIQNAEQEAIERISLSAWWSLNRQFSAKVCDKDVNTVLRENHIKTPKDFSVHMGFVNSIEPGYYVACAILDNNKEHPFAVLGGGCSRDRISAVKKALYESIQSWTATKWIDKHCNTKQKVYWDVGELNSRILSLSHIENTLSENEPVHTNIMSQLSTRVTYREGIYITEVIEPGGTAHTTIELAKLAMKDFEHVSVFTPHNM